MSIAPLKWTLLCLEKEKEIENWENGWYKFSVINHDYIEFNVQGIQEATAKRIVEELNDAMKTQRHEFLWGLANMHNQGTLYGGDEE